MNSTPEIAERLVKLLVVRGDAYAKQFPDGTYINPVKNSSGQVLPWTRELLHSHLDGVETFGHYAMKIDQAKYFCFDLDFKKLAKIPVYPSLENGPEDNKELDRWLANNCTHMAINPRQLFASDPDNEWLRWQMRTTAELMVQQITDVLGVKSLASFSGNKGVHVYGFPEPGKLLPAATLRSLARNVMENMGHYWTQKNASGTFWKGASLDPTISLFEVEIFPKQDYVAPGAYGNLMRMELGVHQKSGKPGFFLDLSADSMDLVPANPLEMLRGLL